jgi:hypothetical protein
MTLEKDEDDWLRLVTDFEENLSHVLNTPSRKKAWSLLPDAPFTYTEAKEAVRPVLKPTAFNAWHRELLRLGLLFKSGDDRYMKASPGHPEKERSK